MLAVMETVRGTLFLEILTVDLKGRMDLASCRFQPG